MFLRSRLRDERGIAMVIAIMVSFVVLMLSLVVVSQSVHNSQQSAYDRNRLLSISSAEAGVDNFFNFLQVTSATQIPCSTSAMSAAPYTRTVGRWPLATYSPTATF